MRYRFLLFCIVIFRSAFSQTGGETLYSFLNLPTSPKQVALGGVTLTSRDDVSQLLWNPSSLNEKIDGDIAINFVSYIADINVGSLVYSKSINPKYGIAFLGVQYFNYGDFNRTDASGPNILGSFSSRDLSFNLGYGYTYKTLSIGATVKYVSSKIDTYTSSALLYDLGITYMKPNSSFVASIVVRNKGKQLTQFINTEEKIQQNVILAAEYQLQHVPIKLYGAVDELNNWNISVANPTRTETLIDGEEKDEEINDIDNAFRHLSVGAELWPEKKFSLRIGYNRRRAEEFQLQEVRTNAGLSYGFGINTKFVRFDYAFSKFQEGAKYSSFGLTLHL